MMIVFVVNDTGPAKYISYIIKNLNNIDFLCISSSISSKVFDSFGIVNIDNTNKIDLSKIQLIITGTCLGNGIDKEWIRIGKQNNIKTISIIEHWSLYKKRFELNGKYNFPDKIFVNDPIAKEEAILDGVDENIIQVVGNPVLENISKREYSLDIKKAWVDETRLNKDKKIITFISEEYKKDFPKGSREYQGFDEFEVLEDIVKNLDNNMQLLVKLHPAENKNKYDYLKEYNNIKIIDKVDIEKLIEISDIVIGMGSMLLLEASLLKANIHSYRPNETIKFIGNKNGMTIHIKNKKELKKIMKNNYSKKDKVIKNNFIGSTNNIIKFIQEYQI